jgi:hypothetical protein
MNSSIFSPLAKLLNLAPDKLVESLASAVDRFVTTAEDKAKLRAELKAELHRHIEANARIAADDRASARSREMALGGRLGVYVQNVAAGAVILAFLVLLFGLFYFPVTAANQRLADLLTGSLAGIVGQLFQYWFGSSQSSQRKQIVLEQAFEARSGN